MAIHPENTSVPDGTPSGPNNVNLGAIEKRSWFLTFALIIASSFFRSWRISMGVATGGVLAILNYLWLKNFVQSIFNRKAGKISKLNALLYVLKYVITGAAIFLVIKYDVVNIFALMAGLMVVIIAITIEGAIRSTRLDKENKHAS